MSSYGQYAARGYGHPVADTRTVFGQVMGLVAITLGFATLGIYIARHLTGVAGIALFVAAIVCLIGLNFAAARSESLAIGLLFAFGLLLGMASGAAVNRYAQTNPSAVWQAAGATGLFIAALGSVGYAIRRDLSAWARTLFWLLLGLIVVGLVLTFTHVPHAHIIYAVLGLLLFGAYTVFDFNRLRRAEMRGAVPLAAGIFLDIFNVFLFFLSLFAGGRD